ncbi:E3 ubiquitin-protein ligase At1g63170-like [Phragmites australis]|uniref:E3 ubiquitin-protein ligase At1g63170-like n=1 Tax=Phragmites australis TaxID=29695 RepID=UPI002D783D0A|nr:E3 ubiquitin-protein ligase At1g63170-like [Phragmites australis]XP_062190093.1 E3 ubiquitin-protein ligase At1g63170-like [Phragmites australis]
MVCWRTLLVLLPPFSVLLLVAAWCHVRVLARNLSALARSQFACPPTGGSSFRYLSVESKHAISELRVAQYSKRRRSYGGCDEEEEPAVECVFCLSGIEEGEEIRELRCRHLFHRGCLDRWLMARPLATCPLCRCRILTSAPLEEDYTDDEEDLDSDMMLFMACVHSRSSWFWPS